MAEASAPRRECSDYFKVGRGLHEIQRLARGLATSRYFEEHPTPVFVDALNSLQFIIIFIVVEARIPLAGQGEFNVLMLILLTASVYPYTMGIMRKCTKAFREGHHGTDHWTRTTGVIGACTPYVMFCVAGLTNILGIVASYLFMGLLYDEYSDSDSNEHAGLRER